MPIVVSCGSCSTKLKAPDATAGKRVKCPKCGEPLTVPAPVPTAPQPKGVLVIPADKPAPAAPPREVSWVASAPPPAPIAKPAPTDLAPVPPPPPPADTKDCPFCGEEIKAVAKKCKHCGEVLDVVLRAAEDAKREARRDRGGNRQTTQVVVGVRNDRGRDRYYKAPFNHGPHLVLDLVTLGLWLPIHILCWICH